MERINRPFSGITTFLRTKHTEDPADYKKAAIAVLGVPFDEGSPFLPGSRMAPRAIREHSLRFPVLSPIYDVDSDETYLWHEISNKLIIDAGDVDVRPANAARTFDVIRARVQEFVDTGVFPVIIGGDHSITYPVFETLNTPAHVIQFDAHQDCDEITEDLMHTNSHPFRHIINMKNCLSLTQVGIRGLRNPAALYNEMKQLGHNVVTMKQVHELGASGIAGLIPAGEAVYISIDIDALDMSLIPGCVSGEPNGMTFNELTDALRAIVETHPVIGFDFVEINPMLDVGTGATSYLGTVIIVTLLGIICNQPRWQDQLASRGLL